MELPESEIHFFLQHYLLYLYKFKLYLFIFWILSNITLMNEVRLS